MVEETLNKMRETTTRPRSRPRANPRENVQRFRFIDVAADEIAGEPVPDADLAGDIKEEEKRQQIKDGAADDVADFGHFEAQLAGGRGNLRDQIGDERHDAESRAQVAQLELGGGVAVEEIRGDEGREESAEAEEQVQEIQCRRAVRFADVAGKRIGSGDDDAAAKPEHEIKNHEVRGAAGGGESGERAGDENESAEESGFLAAHIDEGADGDGRNEESDGLRESDSAVLLPGEIEELRKGRHDGAEHRGDDAVNEDRQDRGEDDHKWLMVSDC